MNGEGEIVLLELNALSAKTMISTISAFHVGGGKGVTNNKNYRQSDSPPFQTEKRYWFDTYIRRYGLAYGSRGCPYSCSTVLLRFGQER